MTTRLLGAMGEQIAARSLREKGYEIIAANYRTKIGEIDIIATKDKYICFVEVKTRKRGGYLNPRDNVDLAKQKRIKDSAQIYMAYKKFKLYVRFDIIEVLLSDNGSHEINHIKDAF